MIAKDRRFRPLPPVTLLFLLGVVLPLMSGTTYVAFEGNKEVGRYEEHDGKNDVKIVRQDAPAAEPVAGEEGTGVTGSVRRSGWFDRINEKFLHLKIEDPDLVDFLNRQPWVQKLQIWDEEHDLEERFTAWRPVMIGAIFGLLSIAVLYRGYRVFRWMRGRARRSAVKIPLPTTTDTVGKVSGKKTDTSSEEQEKAE